MFKAIFALPLRYSGNYKNLRDRCACLGGGLPSPSGFYRATVSMSVLVLAVHPSVRIIDILVYCIERLNIVYY